MEEFDKWLEQVVGVVQCLRFSCLYEDEQFEIIQSEVNRVEYDKCFDALVDCRCIELSNKVEDMLNRHNDLMGREKVEDEDTDGSATIDTVSDIASEIKVAAVRNHSTRQAEVRNYFHDIKDTITFNLKDSVLPRRELCFSDTSESFRAWINTVITNDDFVIIVKAISLTTGPISYKYEILFYAGTDVVHRSHDTNRGQTFSVSYHEALLHYFWDATPQRPKQGIKFKVIMELHKK